MSDRNQTTNLTNNKQSLDHIQNEGMPTEMTSNEKSNVWLQSASAALDINHSYVLSSRFPMHPALSAFILMSFRWPHSGEHLAAPVLNGASLIAFAYTDWLPNTLFAGCERSTSRVSPRAAAPKPVIVWGDNANPALPSTVQHVDLIRTVQTPAGPQRTDGWRPLTPECGGIVPWRFDSRSGTGAAVQPVGTELSWHYLLNTPGLWIARQISWCSLALSDGRMGVISPAHRQATPPPTNLTCYHNNPLCLWAFPTPHAVSMTMPPWAVKGDSGATQSRLLPMLPGEEGTAFGSSRCGCLKECKWYRKPARGRVTD